MIKYTCGLQVSKVGSVKVEQGQLLQVYICRNLTAASFKSHQAKHRTESCVKWACCISNNSATNKHLQLYPKMFCADIRFQF